MAEPGEGIVLDGLWKIFGPRADALLAEARAGMDKATLLSRHNHVLALRDVSLSVPAGQVQVIMGLSGSGKSTLVRLVNRLVDPTAGRIRVGATEVTGLDAAGLRRFRGATAAMVFQRFGLLPHRSVRDNVAYGLAVRGLPAAERHRRAAAWIDRVGLAGYADRLPGALSGGMQQRVGLARALASDAPVLLMDEAFSALDPLIRLDMQGMLLDLQRDLRRTILFITHDLDEALRLGDRVAILRDGALVQNAAPEAIVLQPADAHVAGFVRAVNRGRVLRLGHVAGPLAGSGAGLLPLPARLCLEEAVARLAGAGAAAALVLDEAGRPLGRATLPEVIAAMVQPAATTTPPDWPPEGASDGQGREAAAGQLPPRTGNAPV